MVTHGMMEIARLWVQECKRARVSSGEVYWSEALDPEEFKLTVFDRDGTLHIVYSGGESDDE